MPKACCEDLSSMVNDIHRMGRSRMPSMVLRKQRTACSVDSGSAMKRMVCGSV